MAKKYSLSYLVCCRDEWYPLPDDVVPVKSREKYSARKKAVDMYIDGYEIKEIEKKTGIHHTKVIRLVEKCLEPDENGQYLGYYALIPDKKKVKPDGSKGHFYKLLNEYPELSDFIKGNYFGDEKYTKERIMSVSTLHGKFLKKCKQLGIQEYEYPFNTKAEGYVSLNGYVRNLAAKSINESAKRENKDTRQKLSSTGIGHCYTSNTVIPYFAVQFDGHKSDIGYNVEVDNGDGTISKVMADRFWVLPVYDVSTRAVIDYSMTQAKNYNQFDVLKAFQNALSMHKKLELTIPGLEYPENGGFPSLAIPEYENAMFDTIMFDNAKAHLAFNVIDKMESDLDCVLNFGAVGTPETRGLIERLFGTFESRGFHRIPGTTGSGPKDPRRRNPEKEVVRYDITYDQLHELVEIMFATYNNTPHPALNNETPLQALERKLKNPLLCPKRADMQYAEKIRQLTYITKQVVVRGSIKKGRRPYIQFMNAIYRNDVIAADAGYIGKKISIVIDPDDLRSLRAYSDTGYPLGTLYAEGGYGKEKHTLASRKDAAKLARENKKSGKPSTDPIGDYVDHLQEKAKTSRRYATKADQVRREAGKEPISA